VLTWIVRSSRAECEDHYRVTFEQDWHCDCPARVKCRHIRTCERAQAEGMRLMFVEEK
jgi:hypothetical protein